MLSQYFIGVSIVHAELVDISPDILVVIIWSRYVNLYSWILKPVTALNGISFEWFLGHHLSLSLKRSLSRVRRSLAGDGIKRSRSRPRQNLLEIWKLSFVMYLLRDLHWDGIPQKKSRSIFTWDDVVHQTLDAISLEILLEDIVIMRENSLFLGMPHLSLSLKRGLARKYYSQSRRNLWRGSRIYSEK